jgi:hypothetical protein
MNVSKSPNKRASGAPPTSPLNDSLENRLEMLEREYDDNG